MNRHFRWLGLAAVCGWCLAASAQTQLELLWNLDPGSRAYLPGPLGDNNQRGMAYNPVSGNVLLVSRTSALSVQVIDGLTGADKGTLNVSGITGGTFALSQIAVASDGAIYAANLVSPSSATSPLKIYRWADESAAPTVVYSGEPAAATRWGDNIEIRGAGNSTQILLGQGGSSVGNRIAVLTTADNGASFTATAMTLSGEGFALGDTRGGVAFGSGDTFYTRTAGGPTSPLHFGTFDLANSAAALTAKATLPNSLSGFAAVGTWPEQGLLAAINVDTGANPRTLPQNVYLFDVNDPANPVVLDIEPFINPGNQNLNAAGAADFGNGKLFALDTNNGLRAYTVLIPEPHEYLLLVLGLGAMWWYRRQDSRRG